MNYQKQTQLAVAMDRGRATIVELMDAGAVAAADVRALRRDVFSHGRVSRDEADAIFALEASNAAKCPEWTGFFVETITDHVVWDSRPTGVVNESQGEWLIARADVCASVNALAVLVNVLAEAHRVPGWFVSAVRSRGARGWAGVDIALRLAEAEMALAA